MDFYIRRTYAEYYYINSSNRNTCYTFSVDGQKFRNIRLVFNYALVIIVLVVLNLSVISFLANMKLISLSSALRKISSHF